MEKTEKNGRCGKKSRHANLSLLSYAQVHEVQVQLKSCLLQHHRSIENTHKYKLYIFYII